jgi:hypothetical protein
MGHIVKKIFGDFDKDPHYENFTVEDNSDEKIHIHAKNIRLDLKHDDFNVLRANCLEARRQINQRHGWK